MWQKARWEKWTENYNGERPLENKTVVCGHMPVFYADRFEPSREKNSPDIFYGNGIIAIDAGTYNSKQVNVRVLEENI